MLYKKSLINIINKSKLDKLPCPDIRALKTPNIRERTYKYKNNNSELMPEQIYRRNKSLLDTKCLQDIRNINTRLRFGINYSDKPDIEVEKKRITIKQ